MKQRAHPKVNTNIANVLSNIQGGEVGEKWGEQSSRMGGKKRTKEELEEHKR